MTAQLRFPPPLIGARQPAGTSRPRRTLGPWALATAVLTGQAMASLDAAIVNVAGPALQHDLRLSGAALQLTIYSYLLMYAVGLVTGARLGGRYGFGRLFGYGVAIFTVSSLACGLAENETSASQQGQFPVTEIFSHIEIADGRIWMKPDGVEYFAGDLTAEEQKLVWATHFAPAATLFTKAAAGTAWRTKPSWYIVASDDRTIRPELERFAAKRMGATAREIAASHVPMLSHPDEVLEIIRCAADAVS